MALEDTDIFPRLERFYDAVPRDATVTEDIGQFVLFVREGAGWHYYARPRIGGGTPSAADITAVRMRQRDLGVPEAFEWVHETTSDLLAVARSAGLDVLLAPLMVLDRAALVPDLPVAGAAIRFLDPASADFAADIAASRAVAQLGFGAPASATGAAPATDRAGALVVEPADPAQRDAVPALPEDVIADQVRRHASGRFLTGVVESPTEGILATGAVQRVGGVAEVAGVATLPSARRRGYASQLTASLARRALEAGDDLVFLSAGDDDTARLYSRVGFRRIGTACIGSPAVVAV
ncbi:GNAT family N-acetyltransferase [Couchioplanes caeruleus]|uniref:GNAT family N-acetyltransferase n=2 Tax=Couchioplanes caeruleus TaxID=56438 RepID=A0A1K0GDX0_9ACTN|nr:GNAT family N-acetyltransferase [Couchioplanes caeruleus]OJF15434.1 GNAT family N-acetyltransferase [Couchioplanes caeruleus subsp. caeruleus]ROP29152.1 FR47-like protein [Couchioplanes caeruleus]